jgi:hypothetical protein
LFDREHLFLPDREHFSKKTGIGVHDAITPHGYWLLQALEPAKLLSLSGDK